MLIKNTFFNFVILFFKSIFIQKKQQFLLKNCCFYKHIYKYMENQFQNSEILSENERKAIQNCVENALISNEKFPVDFNDVWQWAGYSRKDSAKRTLKKFFKENKDFMIFDDFSTGFPTRKASDGRPEKGIKLTLDCAINFSLKANSPKSNLVYDFILICKENFEKNNQNTNSEQNDELKPLINLQ